MSVLIVTSLGDIVVDLHTDRCPLTTKNFLKLCKMKYYNGCLFHKVEKDFTAQTGDRTGIGSGGDSLYKFLYGDQARFFDDEIHPELKHNKIGTVAMASAGKNLNASQFYFTLRDDLDYLDGKHTVFGVVEEQEGLDTLAKINEVFVDDKGRPYKNIRIKHTYILDDPFSDPPQLVDFIPEKSPEGKPGDEIAEERLEDNWVPLDETLGPAEMEELIRSKEAHTNAAILESIGDIPDAEIKPPENVLFVCKLNPVTQDEDLHTIFSRFGNVVSADIIRDYKTGDSLCYAFIEFETKEACELAYFKMDNTLIDDRRIHVDFSQSVSKLWNQYRHGKRTEKKGNGCFKCGAPDHIARDCNQGTKGLDNASKYVLKEDNKQRGDGRLSYDMLFDEDDTGSLAHDHDDETGTKVKKQKLDDRRSEDSRQRGYNDRVSDSRSYRNWHGDDGRAHRGVDSRHGDRRQDGHQRAEVSRRRDVDRQEREREMQKHHDSGRHGRGGLDIRKRSSDSDQQSKDVRVDGDSGRRDASGHSNRHERDDDDRTKRNKDGGSDSYRDKESRERKIERYEEDREGRKHHEGSRHGRDDGDYRKRGSEPRLDKKDEDIRRYEGERHAARSGRDDDEHRRRSKDHDKGIKNERGYRDDKR